MKINLKTPLGRIKAWLYAMLVEHNFTNVIRFNLETSVDRLSALV